MAEQRFLDWIVGGVFLTGVLGTALINSITAKVIDWEKVFIILFLLWLVYETLIKK